MELTAALSVATLAAFRAGLMAATIQTALATATSEGLAGMVSTPVAELVHRANAAMMASKVKIPALVLLIVATSGSLVFGHGRASEPLAATLLAQPTEQPTAVIAGERVDDRVEVKSRVQTADGKPLADARIYDAR